MVGPETTCDVRQLPAIAERISSPASRSASEIRTSCFEDFRKRTASLKRFHPILGAFRNLANVRPSNRVASRASVSSSPASVIALEISASCFEVKPRDFNRSAKWA